MNTASRITFDILYDEDGGALVTIIENGEEHSRHYLAGNVARQWAQQEVACIEERRAEEAEWLACWDDSHRLDY